MELRHLRYFVVLAEELHFGRAAQRLSITQPPLSFNIQKLEEHLGMRLFARDSRRVRLTPVGQAFLAEARRVLAQARHAEETARAVADGKLGSLQIGFTTSMLYRGMTDMLRQFRKDVPMVDFDLIDMPVLEQVEALQQGRIHAAFSTSLTLPRGLAGHRLPDDALACCVHEDHWLAGRQRIKLGALVDETFVLFSRDTTAAGHELVMQMCVAAGFYPKVRYYVRQWLSAVSMVSQGFGVALVPLGMARAAVPQVRFVALDDPRGQLPAYLLWNPGSVSPALERLIAHVTAAPPPKAAARRRSNA
ncbi:LysR substrate-binding domain-containing protein [Pseudorhodoferax sp.]|uniref:LysR substrate-binding domain-containing protein n=1 Tax=Pseudorhodoferax sp. TaxID=1993553 RepID=UPI002DD64CD9|nr:LysR substrate-binding domain-containing protein [Pseudorhodoferax sp.]